MCGEQKTARWYRNCTYNHITYTCRYQRPHMTPTEYIEELGGTNGHFSPYVCLWLYVRMRWWDESHWCAESISCWWWFIPTMSANVSLSVIRCELSLTGRVTGRRARRVRFALWWYGVNVVLMLKHLYVICKWKKCVYGNGAFEGVSFSRSKSQKRQDIKKHMKLQQAIQPHQNYFHYEYKRI